MIHHRVMPSIGDACKRLRPRYTGGVPETAGNWIGVQNVHRRTTAARRYFFVRLSLLASNGRALAGVRSRTPVSDDAGTPTLSCARPPRLASGRGYRTAVIGGRIMRHTLARPEQTRTRHIFSAAAGRDAAEQWLTDCPNSTAGEYRDSRFVAHACGVGFNDMAERRQAFNSAFERAIAGAIVAVFVVEVANG